MEIIEYTPGLTIAPGETAIVANMPNAVYHSHEHLSNSNLSLLARSPAHFRYAANKPATSAIQFGSAVHCALLEPDRFNEEYVLLEGVKDRRQAEYKAAVAVHGEEYVLLPKDADAIRLLVESVNSQPALKHWLDEPGHVELSVFSVDPETGTPIRCRFDKLTLSGVSVDIKTTQDARPDAFARSILQYGYYRQSEFYNHVFKAATGRNLEEFKFMAIESDVPHAGLMHRLDETALNEGRREIRELIDLYARCNDSGIWPMYGDDECLTSLPDWKIRQIENDLEINV